MFRSPSRFDFPFFRKRYPVLDPRYFDDPVALRTGWVPLSPGGSRHTMNCLREIAPKVLSFQPTAYSRYQFLVHLLSLLFFGNTLMVSLLRKIPPTVPFPPNQQRAAQRRGQCTETKPYDLRLRTYNFTSKIAIQISSLQL